MPVPGGMQPLGYGGNDPTANRVSMAQQAQEPSPIGRLFQQMYGLQQGQQTGDYALKQQKMANQGNLAQAQTAAEANKYGSNTQLAAIQAQLAQSQGRYNQIFPMLQSAFGGGGGVAGGGVSNSQPYGGMSAGGGGGAVGNYGYGTAQAPQYGQGGEESNMNLLQIGSGYGPGPGVGTPKENAASKASNDAVRAANAKAGVFDSSPRLPGDTENKGVMYQGYPYGTTPPATGAGTAQSGGGGGGGYQSALPPAISPGQLQANINLNNAQNWSQAGGESRRQTQQVAGSGLGATSPLARALQAQTFGGALAANTAGATTARQGAAELNAKQLLGAYQADQAAQASRYGSQLGAQASMYGSQTAANASQYNARLNYQAALAQVQAQRQNSLLAALSNFAGSV